MDCVTLVVRWRVIRPHVEDQLPHRFQEQATLMQGPFLPQKLILKNKELYQFAVLEE